MHDPLAGKAFSCSICTCFIDMVEVNMQCCLPYTLYYRSLLLVSEFCRNTCVYKFIGVFLFLRARTPIKLCSADSLCLLIVSSLLPIYLYLCISVFLHFVFVYLYFLQYCHVFGVYSASNACSSQLPINRSFLLLSLSPWISLIDCSSLVS